ncbi:hypothetical protein [Streptomyces sp. NBC_00076]|uniref:hypothetical protein n=1 Tax=Streptomyces sp. NBC_00076 TaxID=2975642 RepID=UPI0038639BA2
MRCRSDFKYALAIELDDPSFHHSVLADFTGGKGVRLAFDPIAGPGVETLAQGVVPSGYLVVYGALDPRTTPLRRQDQPRARRRENAAPVVQIVGVEVFASRVAPAVLR